MAPRHMFGAVDHGSDLRAPARTRTYGTRFRNRSRSAHGCRGWIRSWLTGRYGEPAPSALTLLSRATALTQVWTTGRREIPGRSMWYRRSGRGRVGQPSPTAARLSTARAPQPRGRAVREGELRHRVGHRHHEHEPLEWVSYGYRPCAALDERFRSRLCARPRRPQPRQVAHSPIPRVRGACEQLVGLGQHQRVRTPLPPGLVPHRQSGRVDLGVHVPASIFRQRPFEDPLRPGAEEGPERVAEAAPTTRPCDRPVVVVT